MGDQRTERKLSIIFKKEDKSKQHYSHCIIKVLLHSIYKKIPLFSIMYKHVLPTSTDCYIRFLYNDLILHGREDIEYLFVMIIYNRIIAISFPFPNNKWSIGH